MVRRTRSFVPALTLTAATLVIAGCGSDDGARAEGRTDPTPATGGAATTPTAGTAESGKTARRARTAGSKMITPIADYTGAVSISYRDGLLAVAAGGADGRQLRVAVDRKALPEPAEGAGPIPVWGRIHVGSNGPGTRVVTYPRCETATLSTCDVYEWNSTTHRERPLPGASNPGRAELEATEDWGDVVVVTSLEPDASLDADALLEEPDPTGAVTVAVRGRRPYRLLASGGYGVVLSYGNVGLLQFEPSDPCGIVTARLFDRRERRQLFRHRTPCDQEEGGEPVGAAIVGGEFMFGFTRTYERAGVFAHPINTGPRRQTSGGLPGTAVDYAPVSATAGYVVDGSGCDGRWDGTPPRGGCKVDFVEGLDLE